MSLVPDPVKTGLAKTKKVRRAWNIYKWIDRLRNWQDWYTWGYSLLQTKAGVAAALGTTAAMTTAAVVTHNAIVAPEREPFVQTEVTPLAVKPAPEPLRQTQSTLIFAIEGRDKVGRRGTFDVVVAKKQFLWVRGSSEELEKEGKTVSGEALAAEVLDDEVRRSLEAAKEVIAVGTASQEGDAKEETERAGRRAKRTAELVATGIPAAIPISSLNLGQFRGACPSCGATGSNWQRPFMVIAVKDLEPGTILGEALADAMTGKEKLPSPASYSAFVLERVR